MTLITRDRFIDVHLDERVREELHYHRQLENDFGTTIPNSVKDIGIAALSFLGLFHPFKKMVTLFGSTARGVSGLGEIQKASNSKEQCAGALKTAFAVASIAGTIYCSSLGMIMTTGYDTAGSALQLAKHIGQADYSSALAEGTQFFSNSLYLGVLLSGSIPLLLISSSVDILHGLYKSANEFRNGNEILGASHIINTAIRARFFKSQCKLLQPETEWD